MTFPNDDRVWYRWIDKAPPSNGTIVLRRGEDLSGQIVRVEDLRRDPQMNVNGLYWTLNTTLDSRVAALEKALAAQDSVHKMNIKAIANSLRGLLDDFIDDLEKK